MNWYFDQARNVLVYEHLNSILTQYIPEAVVAQNRYTIIPRNLRNSQILRYLNYPVPPIMTEYSWPAPPGFKPYESQITSANFMVLHRRCFNLSDMGVGKTLATLWAADWLMKQHENFRALIVCPLSIMQRVWADAIFKNFLGQRSFEILHGDAERRTKGLAKPADFYIVNFDGISVGAHTRKRLELDGFCKTLAEREDIRLAIVDEASAYKDAQTLRHRISRQVFGKKDYLWLLTGTPTPNAPTDAYGLAKLVNNSYGKSFSTFQSETMRKITQFKWLPQPDGYQKARALLSPSIRYDISDVWDAPPETTQQREVELTAAQKKMMADFKRDLQVTVKSGTAITAINEGALRNKFLQVAMGAVYDSDHKEHVIDCEPRLREAENVLESTGRKVVIFVGLTSVLNLLNRRLSKRWKGVVINGHVSAKQRAENIRLFAEDDSIKYVLADPGATAHGINEFALVADTCLWYSPSEKNELYLQGNRRVNRPGQRFPMTIVQLVATPLEREIYKRLETNTSLQGVLLEMVRRGEL